MKSPLKLISLIAISLLFTACASTPSLSDQILGSWSGNMQGFDVTLIYSESEITVDGFGMSFPYTVEGSQISMDVPQMGMMTMDVVIDGDKMTQTDTNSGEVAVFNRKM